MNIYFFPSFIISLLLLFLGIFILTRPKVSNDSLIFSCVCFVSFLWLFSYSFAYNSHNKDIALFWFKLGYPGVVLLPVAFLHFTIRFLQLKKLNLVVLLVYFWAATMIYLIWKTDFFVKDVGRFFWGYYPLAGRLHPLFLVTFFLLANLSFSLLAFFLFFRKKQIFPIKRNQIKYILLAFAIYTGASVDFLPNYNVSVYPFGFLPTFLFLTIITFAIVRYRLRDIAVVITRTGIFVAVYSLVLGIPFFLAYALEGFFRIFLGEKWWIFPLLTSTVLATIGPFIFIYMNKKAENRLLKEQRSYQNVLRNASNGMIRIKKLDRLLNVIAHVVTKAVKLSHASIFLLNKEHEAYTLRAERGIKNALMKNVKIDFGSPLIWWLTQKRDPIVAEEAILRLSQDVQNIALSGLVRQLSALKASLVIPSFVEDRLIGILILGEKRSKKLYSQDDIVVFSVLANQAALAIENAQFYDEIKQTHEQLFQAEKLATIGTMADGLSHQINNRFHALSLIAGDSLDMLKTFDSSACNDEAKQVLSDLRGALERIESNVLQGGEVVKGLLKYSRPGDTGHEAVDFRDVVNGSIDMVQYKIKLKEIDLVQDIPQDIPKIHANLIQLQEVFFNLIDNAYDAIKERQNTLKQEGYRGKIQIKVHASDAVLNVVVSDNGMGIKDLDRKKLFTPFFTTKATAKKGTGLGLYVIEKIISSHKGKIHIDSIYQTGTNFNIELPIFKSKNPDPKFRP